MKYITLLTSLFAIAINAQAIDCDDVSCPQGWTGPFTKEICYIDEDDDTIRFDVCYCIDTSGATPRFRIIKGELGYNLDVYDWDEMIWWAGSQIAQDEFSSCAPPDEYGNCNTPYPYTLVEDEVWECWYWKQTHPNGPYKLTPCGVNICIYITTLTCRKSGNECCIDLSDRDPYLASQCDTRTYPDCIRGCATANPGGKRLCYVGSCN